MSRFGTMTTVGGRPALRFERRYPHPVERVWRAVSDPHEMGRWFPAEVLGDQVVGAALTFDDEAHRAAAGAAGEATRADGPPITGTVVACEPPTLLSFTWGGELLRFDLAPDGSGTVLVFTHVLSHPSVAARNGAGWHRCLEALDGLLDVAPEGDAVAPDSVYDDYLTRVGPALGAPSGGGALCWERSTPVGPERVRAATSTPEAMAAWGAAGRAADPLRWELEATAHGTVYRLTHEAVGDDACLAAEWHALLLQLDMHLAAGQLLPADASRWVEPYEALLGS